MSATIEVIAVNRKHFSFEEVIEDIRNRLNQKLTSLGIKEMTLNVSLHQEEEQYQLPCNPEADFVWKEDEFLWFTIEDVDGGIQVYRDTIKDELIDPTDPWWCLEEMIQQNTTISDIETYIEGVKNMDTCWYVNRNFGMSAIFYVLQGVITETLATLSDGIIWNEDGAWEFEKFPMLVDEFSKSYLIAESTENSQYQELAEDCFKEIKEKFGK